MNDIIVPPQQQRLAPETTASNTLVYVQYTSSGFQWGLSTTALQALSEPISVASSTRITFEFLAYGSAAIWYKLPPTAPNGSSLPSTNGPTTIVSPGSSASISFAGSPTGSYYGGYVKVSPDGLDDLLVDTDDD